MLANFAMGDARLDLFGARVQLLENLGDRGVSWSADCPVPAWAPMPLRSHTRACRMREGRRLTEHGSAAIRRLWLFRPVASRHPRCAWSYEEGKQCYVS